MPESRVTGRAEFYAADAERVPRTSSGDERFGPAPRRVDIADGVFHDRTVPQATDEILARLEGLGHRATGSRRAVLDAIALKHTPFTVEEISEETPGVGRATVFRTMKLLQDLDLVCRLPLGDGGVRYEVSRSAHHHHLICSNCGAVTEFSDPELDSLIVRNASTKGFRLDGHSLELYGLCARCARAAN
ncbi:MAG: Fur family transcriptional regulator [Anaerolineaceae bacterium]